MGTGATEEEMSATLRWCWGFRWRFIRREKEREWVT